MFSGLDEVDEVESTFELTENSLEELSSSPVRDGLNLCKYLGDILRMSIPLNAFLRATVTAGEVLLDEVMVGEGDYGRQE